MLRRRNLVVIYVAIGRRAEGADGGAGMLPERHARRLRAAGDD